MPANFHPVSALSFLWVIVMNYLEAFPALRQMVDGRDCILVGSAPGAKTPAAKDNQILCYVNGAMLGATPSRDIDVWFLNSCTLLSKSLAASKTQPLISKASPKTSLLVAIGACGDGETARKAFAAINCIHMEYMGRQGRCQFIESVTGLSVGDAGQSVPSTGIFAAITLMANGAKSVECHGFTFNDKGGHSYLDGQKTPRGHLDVDVYFKNHHLNRLNVEFKEV